MNLYAYANKFDVYIEDGGMKSTAKAKLFCDPSRMTGIGLKTLSYICDFLVATVKCVLTQPVNSHVKISALKCF